VNKGEFAAGTFWIASTAGLSAHTSYHTGHLIRPPLVHITGASHGKRSMSDGEQLDYDHYTMHFNFLSVSLNQPDAIEYRYRLLGADTGWTFTESRHVSFQRIAEGSFTFQVLAINKATGLASREPATFSFSVRQPVWKSAWFYLVLAVLVAVLCYVIIRLRTQQLLRTQKLLETKIRQKTYLLQREKEEVERIKVQLELRNKDVTDSINYAKRLQDSILPPEEKFSEMFGSEWFVLFKPKDIVSGDFYWTGKLNGGSRDLQLAAVIDCTGHGVPGAFLSVMANDLLVHTVKEGRVNNTNELLDSMNRTMSSHLNQSSSRGKVRDGMDIAMVAIDRSVNKLYFSGANNPAYVFRETPEGIQHFVLAPTKQAIGLINESTQPFGLTTFDLKHNDRIYLFSDGFADQFGGPLNKKLTYKRFRALIAESFKLPMAEQKAFLESKFLEWKHEEEQVDDVCIMSIRYCSRY
jgi:serine phosphatase RsbU (regulator of sigma subunit)